MVPPAFRRRRGAEIVRVNREGPGGPHHSRGLAVDAGKHGAQGVVARPHGLDRLLENRGVEPAADVQVKGNDVGGAGGVQLLHEPEPFLQARQGIRPGGFRRGRLRRPLIHQRIEKDFRRVPGDRGRSAPPHDSDSLSVCLGRR